jgi:purine nucleosidase
MTRLWLDTDIGSDVDDAVALLCALRHPEIRLVGVSTVFRRVDLRAWIVEEMLRRAGASGVPVMPGAMGTFDGAYGPGEEKPAQAEGAPPMEALSPEQDGERIEAIARAMGAIPGEFHLLTIGPLTNLGHLVVKHPEVRGKWQSVTCMAGHLERPEYNVQCDVRGAAEAFRKLGPRVVGFEACDDVLPRAEVEEALDPSDPASAFLLECYRLYRGQPGWHKDPETAPMTLFDAITLLSLIREEWYDFQDLRVMVEKDGRLRLTDDGAAVRYAATSDWGKIKPVIVGLLRGG